MPHREGDDVRNVVFNEMNKPFTDYALDEAAMAKWAAVVTLRSDVNAVLEAARAEKRIGKSLEAHVTLYPQGAAGELALQNLTGLDLAELFIVSQVTVAFEAPSDARAGAGLPAIAVRAEEAQGCLLYTSRCV